MTKFSAQVTYLDAIVMLTIYVSWIDSYGRLTCISKHLDAAKCSQTKMLQLVYIFSSII